MVVYATCQRLLGNVARLDIVPSRWGNQGGTKPVSSLPSLAPSASLLSRRVAVVQAGNYQILAETLKYYPDVCKCITRNEGTLPNTVVVVQVCGSRSSSAVFLRCRVYVCISAHIHMLN